MGVQIRQARECCTACCTLGLIELEHTTKKAPQARKCRTAVLHSLACGDHFLWSPCSAEHTEHDDYLATVGLLHV